MFDGVHPWPQNEPVVEVVSEDEVIDLHNWGTFIGFTYRLPEELILRFNFDETQGGLRGGATTRQLRLRFDGVSDLRVHRQPLEHSYESDALSEFFYRELRPGRGWVQVTMMDGFTITFEAGLFMVDEDKLSRTD